VWGGEGVWLEGGEKGWGVRRGDCWLLGGCWGGGWGAGGGEDEGAGVGTCAGGGRGGGVDGRLVRGRAGGCGGVSGLACGGEETD